HFKLRVHHVVLAAALAWFAAGAWAATSAWASLDVLRQRGGRGAQVRRRLTDRLHVLAAHRLLRPLDRRLDGGLVLLLQFVAVLLKQLFHLEDNLIRVIASLNQLDFLFIFCRMGIRFMAHPFDFLRTQTAGAFDLDLVLLAGVFV